MTGVNIAQCLIVICVFFNISMCLYEDQIGKFDWRQTYVGKLKFASFDSLSSVKKIIVATEENVVAALNQKSGQIIWRHVLEKDEHGEIQFMDVDSDIVTVSGRKTFLVRGWDSNAGYLQWEWPITQITTDKLSDIKWFMRQKQLFKVALVAQSHIEVTVYDVSNGSVLSSKTIQAPWIVDLTRCIMAGPHIACLETKEEGMLLNSIILTEDNAELHSKSLNMLLKAGITASQITIDRVQGSLPIIAINTGDVKQIVMFQSSGPKVLSQQIPHETGILTLPHGKLNILLQALNKDGILELSADVLETGEQLDDLAGTIKYPPSLGPPELAAAVCSPRKDKGLGCRIVLSTHDHAIALLLHPGKIVWVREEAMASIVAVEMLDLPVSDTDAAIEQEFDHKETGFVGMFIHRLTSQFLQLRATILAVLGFGEVQSDSQRTRLVRDEFGLHKMVIAATSAGKLFGIDNLSGELLWEQRLENVVPYSDQVSGKVDMPMFIQRTARHFPHPSQCALLVRRKISGMGVLYIFNPLTGQPLDGNNGYIELGYKVKQTSLLHQLSKEFLRGLLILDDKDVLHIYPESTREIAAAVASNTFLFTADPNTGVLSGYSLAFTTKQNLIASRVWEVKLTEGSQRITSVVSKSPLEKVHSQGRVLGDRSVLYKYINPNLVAVVTQGSDQIQKHVLNIYLLDVVSGTVVFSISHQRAREPVHLVHSENWVIYSYVSDKSRASRRTEIVTLELYEGKTQSNTTAFSSVTTPLQPIVDRQAYILPSVIDSMKETITEKGITSKHILVALSSGGILELPWVFVDPRRPVTATPEMREEGVIPYMPELPIPPDAIINYNQTLHRVKGIHTSPSGLESTCLVLIHGLDIFYTRVAPSKTFDVLKEDFDHFLITVVLLALTVASYVTRKLASKKALKQAWK